MATRIHYHPTAAPQGELVMSTPLHRTAGDGYGDMQAASDWAEVDCKLCLRKRPEATPVPMPAESDSVSLVINADARGWYPATFTHHGRHYAMVPGGPSTHTPEGVLCRAWNDRARMVDIMIRPTDNVVVSGYYNPFGQIVAAAPEHPYSPGDRVSYTPAGGSPLTGTVTGTEARAITVHPDGIGGMSHILYPANDAISILEGV